MIKVLDNVYDLVTLNMEQRFFGACGAPLLYTRKRTR